MDKSLEAAYNALKNRSIPDYATYDQNGSLLNRGHMSCHSALIRNPDQKFKKDAAGRFMYDERGYKILEEDSRVKSALFTTWHRGLYKGPEMPFDDPARQAFYKWLFDDSPFVKNMNIRQYNPELTPNGFVVGDVPKHDGTMLYAFVIASRGATEYPAAIRGWYWLTSGGVDPTFAYLLVCGNYLGGDVPQWIGSGHGPLYGREVVDEDYIKNWLNGTPKRPGPIGKISPGVNELWGHVPSTVRTAELYRYSNPDSYKSYMSKAGDFKPYFKLPDELQMKVEYTESWSHRKLSINYFMPTIEWALEEQKHFGC